nr:acyltransferase family protein [Acinetobacter schindleri]
MLSNIQILRAFAAINVVIFHVIGASLHYKIPATSLLFMKDWGQNGVDIFFVISGFIMVYIQEKKIEIPYLFLKIEFKG